MPSSVKNIGKLSEHFVMPISIDAVDKKAMCLQNSMFKKLIQNMVVNEFTHRTTDEIK
jgi:hypothetical protein